MSVCVCVDWAIIGHGFLSVGEYNKEIDVSWVCYIQSTVEWVCTLTNKQTNKQTTPYFKSIHSKFQHNSTIKRISSYMYDNHINCFVYNSQHTRHQRRKQYITKYLRIKPVEGYRIIFISIHLTASVAYKHVLLLLHLPTRIIKLPKIEHSHEQTIATHRQWRGYAQFHNQFIAIYPFNLFSIIEI